VAIATIHPQIACMEFVAVGNRLRGAITNVCVFGGTVVPEETDH
jgi:hypothetical protein